MGLHWYSAMHRFCLPSLREHADRDGHCSGFPMDDPVPACLCLVEAYDSIGSRTVVVVPGHQYSSRHCVDLLVCKGKLENDAFDRRGRTYKQDNSGNDYRKRNAVIHETEK